MPNATAGKSSSQKQAKAAKAKKVSFPGDWNVTEHEDGKFSATKNIGGSELTAYGADEQELGAAIADYEQKIDSGRIIPRA